MADKSGALVDAQANNDAAIFDELQVLDGPVVSGTVLVTWGSLTWVAASGGNGQIAVSGVPLTQAAAAGGVASHGRLRNSGTPTETVDDLTVTVTGGGGNIEINNTTIVAAQDVDLTGFTWTKPTTTA